MFINAEFVCLRSYSTSALSNNESARPRPLEALYNWWVKPEAGVQLTVDDDDVGRCMEEMMMVMRSWRLEGLMAKILIFGEKWIHGISSENKHGFSCFV